MSYLWKSKDGTQLPVEEMADSHLRFSLRIVQERLREIHEKYPNNNGITRMVALWHADQHHAEDAMLEVMRTRGLTVLPLRTPEQLEARKHAQATQEILPIRDTVVQTYNEIQEVQTLTTQINTTRARIAELQRLRAEEEARLARELAAQTEAQSRSHSTERNFYVTEDDED